MPSELDDPAALYLVRIGSDGTRAFGDRAAALAAFWTLARANSASRTETVSALRAASSTEGVLSEAALVADLTAPECFSLALSKGTVFFETVVPELVESGSPAPRIDEPDRGAEAPVPASPQIEPASPSTAPDDSFDHQAPRDLPASSDSADPDGSSQETGEWDSLEAVEWEDQSFEEGDERASVGSVVEGVDLAKLLVDLNEGQRAAVLATSGPVCILAGAGTGKTRVITRRVAYAIASGAVDPARILVVTFTEKAAHEMVERLVGLGLAQVKAATFHGAALAQLRDLWPRFSEEPFPQILSSKAALAAELARDLPGGYRFLPARDLAAEIEWAKVRRLTPATYGASIAAAAHHGPLPADLFRRFWLGYERRKGSAIDFEDMLGATLALIEKEPEAARIIRARYTWFSVDEYQDTNPLQQALLSAWLGDRSDLCVVGDPDQTIYTFAGASADYLTSFPARHPGTRTFNLVENYRSSPQVLALANRLLAGGPTPRQLQATRPAGPEPIIAGFSEPAAERTGLVKEIRRLGAGGVPADEIAILVRTNAQIPPLEEALNQAKIAFRVRGERFFDRAEIRTAMSVLREARGSAAGPSLTQQVIDLWVKSFGFALEAHPAGEEAQERQEALLALLDIVRASDRAGLTSLGDLSTEIERRATAERRAQTDRQADNPSVELLTLHRAKGLEWEAVLLPSLEEGLLPIRQATRPEQVEEERRLFYVALTRARRYLWLAWASRRQTSTGRLGTRKASRFLAEVSPGGRAARFGASSTKPVPLSAVSVKATAPSSRAPAKGIAAVSAAAALDSAGHQRLSRLWAWRTAQAKAAAIPAYRVAPNAALEALAESDPRNLEELSRVPGFGPARIEKYGATLIKLLGTVRAKTA